MDSRDRRENTENRKNPQRRIQIERRLVNDPSYHGPQHRKILDRRGGIDQRQIFE